MTQQLQLKNFALTVTFFHWSSAQWLSFLAFCSLFSGSNDFFAAIWALRPDSHSLLWTVDVSLELLEVFNVQYVGSNLRSCIVHQQFLRLVIWKLSIHCSWSGSWSFWGTDLVKASSVFLWWYVKAHTCMCIHIYSGYNSINRASFSLPSSEQKSWSKAHEGTKKSQTNSPIFTFI